MLAERSAGKYRFWIRPGKGRGQQYGELSIWGTFKGLWAATNDRFPSPACQFVSSFVFISVFNHTEVSNILIFMVYLFNTDLLRANYVPISVLCNGDKTVILTSGVLNLVGETDIKLSEK